LQYILDYNRVTPADFINPIQQQSCDHAALGHLERAARNIRLIPQRTKLPLTGQYEHPRKSIFPADSG